MGKNMACPHCEKQHIDDYFVHRIISVVEQTDQTEVTGLDVEIPSVGHTEVESADPKKQTTVAVVSCSVGNISQPPVGGIQGHTLKLDDRLQIIAADVGIVDDCG